MFLEFSEGYLIGLGMVVFIGPVFFLLLSSTLESGFIPGLLVALGIIVSDIIFVVLCKFGLAQFISEPAALEWIALIGAVLLISIGIKYLKAPVTAPITQHIETKNLSAFFIKGFLVNFINPFVLAIWIGIISFSEQKTNSNVYLTGILLGIFSLDLLKVILAKRIKHLFKPLILQWTYRVFGLLLILFGIRMFIYFYFEKFQ